ncbi:MAG: hypothetical protein PHS33_08990 [Candidatus Omnitrophica bacterium]|nr:hypothetical protein [Candidatus Omnitrophota bacterium]
MMYKTAQWGNNVTPYEVIERDYKKSKGNEHSLSVFGSKSRFLKKYSYIIEDYKQRVAAKSQVHTIGKYDPEFHYFRVIAVHGDIPNDNGDMFRWGSMDDKNSPELMRYDPTTERYVYESFIGRGNFKNHANDDVSKAVGVVFDAVPNHDGRFIESLLAVDSVKDPDLVRSIDKGYINAVSMGAVVGHSYCSICNNLARTESDFCEHIRVHKAQKIHIGGKEQHVYEDNRQVNFIELSWVTLPADKSALLLEKVASKVQNGEVIDLNDQHLVNAVATWIYLYGEDHTRALLGNLVDAVQEIKTI